MQNRRFIFLFLILTTFFSYGLSDKDNIDRLIDKAYKYYDFAILRNDDLRTINYGIDCLNDALIILNNSDYDSKNKEKLMFSINSGLSELKNFKKRVQLKTVGVSPVFNYLINDLKISWIGSFKNKVIIDTVKKLDFKEINGPVIIVSEGADGYTEELIREYISKEKSCDVLTVFDLSDYINQEQWLKLRNRKVRTEVIEVLKKDISDNPLYILDVYYNRKLDNVYFYRADITEYNQKEMSKIVSNSESFIEQLDPVYLYVFLLLFFGFIASLIFNFLDKDNKGKKSPIYLPTISMLFSFILFFIINKGIGAVPINFDSLIFSQTGIITLIAIGLVFVIFPVIIEYIILSKLDFTSSILNYPASLSSVIFGNISGSFMFFGIYATGLFGEQIFLNLLFAMSAEFVFAYFSGKSISDYILKVNKKDLVLSIIFFIIMYFYFYVYILFDFSLLLYYTVASSVFMVLSYFIVPLIIQFVSWLTSLRHKTVEENNVGLKWLRNQIAEPSFFHVPWKNYFDQAVSFITENDDPKIEVVFIEADGGCGKTRTANEIAKEIKKIYDEQGNEATILFGDCNEFTSETDIVPFEPFAQAMGDILGVGRFADPTEKAEKLKSGLIGAGLQATIGAVGMGAISALLDAETGDNVRKTNLNELVTVISETLIDLSKKRNGKVVFILDDTQWIDNDTFEMMKALFDKLINEFNDNEISFIFTSRKVGDDDKVKSLLVQLEDQEKVNIFKELNQALFENDQVVSGLVESFSFEHRSSEKLISHFNEMGIKRPLQIIQFIETLLDKHLIEEMGNVFILSSKANLKRLPPPKDLQRMITEKLDGLDPVIIDVLQCCSLFGKTFKISIISNIFNIDVLTLLGYLKPAEDKNIIKDVTEEDEVFQFCEKRMVSIFRNLNPERGTGSSLSQRIREYHKRFIEVKENDFKKKNINSTDYPYTDIIALAMHSKMVKDVKLEKAIFYNQLAGEQTFKKGILMSAERYFESAIDMVEASTKNIEINIKVNLYLSYAKCLVEEGKYDNVDEIINKINSTINRTDYENESYYEMNDYILLKALYSYKTRKFEKAYELSRKIAEDKNAAIFHKLRAEFYMAASLAPSETEQRYKKHFDLISRINEMIDSENSLKSDEKIELLKVLSEAYNNLGFITLFGLKKYEEAKTYFENSQPLNNMPEINDLKGIAISHGGIGDCYSALGEKDKAIDEYNENLKISRQIGDKQGICRMTSMIAGIYLEKEENQENEKSSDFFDTAFRLYNESYSVALEMNNNINIAFALAGLVNYLRISKNMSKKEYIESIVNNFSSQASFETLPDFAKNALNSSIEKLKESGYNGDFKIK